MRNATNQSLATDVPKTAYRSNFLIFPSTFYGNFVYFWSAFVAVNSHQKMASQKNLTAEEQQFNEEMSKVEQVMSILNMMTSGDKAKEEMSLAFAEKWVT